jgi:hypothetical protein
MAESEPREAAILLAGLASISDREPMAAPAVFTEIIGKMLA